MTNKEQYIPISCERHSEYELAIIRGYELNIRWLDEHNKTNSERLRPYDLLTDKNGEYLLARNQRGENKEIRLDRIVEAYPN